MSQPPISSRKADHIDLCIDGDVAFKRKSNLIEEIELIKEITIRDSINQLKSAAKSHEEILNSEFSIIKENKNHEFTPRSHG